MPDKRLYERTKISVDALLYDCHDNTEIVCAVDNISERGICFWVPDSEPGSSKLHAGDPLSFQFTDEFVTATGTEDVIMSHKCIIRHITHMDGFIKVGCYITEPEFEKYAIRKRIEPLFHHHTDHNPKDQT